MVIFHAENKKGIKAKPPTYTLSVEQFHKCLQKGLEQNLFGAGSKVTTEQLADLIVNLEPTLKNKAGLVMYDQWLQKYVGDFYSIHFALTGNDSNMMPKWDAVIECFETLDQCRVPSRNGESDHTLSWDHFRKALRMAAIPLPASKVQKIIDNLDHNKTGKVNWHDMVSASKAPYFFDGKTDYDVRQLLRHGWPSLFETCRDVELKTRKTDKALLPQLPKDMGARSMGVLTPALFTECLKDTPALNLRARDNPKEHPLVKKINDMCEAAFKKKDHNGDLMKDAHNDKHLIDYEKLCRHYAGASFDAEREFERKWEVIIEVLKELKDSYAGRQLSRDGFKKRLSECNLHVSDSTIDYLLRDQPVSTVDMEIICWRTAKSTILSILKKRWSLLMRLFRAKDTHNTNRLDTGIVQSILDRADVGMSTSLVEILMQNLMVEDDGKIDYDKVLSGRLKTGTFSIDIYTAYKTMESAWQTLSQQFWEYDLNGDGIVNHEEFRYALRNLHHPALSDPIVISDLIKFLDPNGDPAAVPPTDNIDFDKFSWGMARGDLKQVVELRGRDILHAFRREATLEFNRFKGLLPRDRAVDAINKALVDSGVKPILVKILVSRAETRPKVGAETQNAVAKTWIEEGQLSIALREIAGDSFDRAEESALRESFMTMLQASKLAGMDTWRLKGEDHSEPKKLSGAASLGADALRHLGPVPLKRLHMQYFLKQGGQFMLECMLPSQKLIEIKEDRVQTIYSRDPWISFWQQRASYRSPALPSVAQPAPDGAKPQPAHHTRSAALAVSTAPSSVPTFQAGPEKSQAGPDNAWEQVKKKVSKAVFEKFQTNQEALNFLDPEDPGAGAIETPTLRRALESLAPLNAAELELISERLDPRRDGMVLKSDIAFALLPHSTDRSALERLAQERHARGIYARLRGRQVPLPSSLHAPTFTHVANARPDSSTTHTRSGAQQTAGERVSAEEADYRYRYAWDRVQHPPGMGRSGYVPLSRYSVAGEYQNVQAARPGAYSGNVAEDPWTIAGQGSTFPNVRQPATSAHFTSYASGYPTSTAAVNRYGGAGPDYQRAATAQMPYDPYVPQQPNYHQQQSADLDYSRPVSQPAGQFWCDMSCACLVCVSCVVLVVCVCRV